MLIPRRRWLRYNNSVFEDMTSRRRARTRTRASCTHTRFSWIIYLTDLPTGRFYVYNPASSLSRLVSHHIQLASGRHTGVSYQWPINAGRGSTIRVYLRARRDRFRECPRGTEFFFQPPSFSTRFSEKREILANGIANENAALCKLH